VEVPVAFLPFCSEVVETDVCFCCQQPVSCIFCVSNQALFRAKSQVKGLKSQRKMKSSIYIVSVEGENENGPSVVVLGLLNPVAGGCVGARLHVYYWVVGRTCTCVVVVRLAGVDDTRVSCCSLCLSRRSCCRGSPGRPPWTGCGRTSSTPPAHEREIDRESGPGGRMFLKL